MNQKTLLRQQLLKQRKSLNRSQVKSLSDKVCRHLFRFFDLASEDNIASYCAIGNEVDLSALLNSEHNIYLPVIESCHSMVFKKFDSFDNCRKNKFGILEPFNTAAIKPKELSLCFVPLVGFNRNGHRLGMGGGYYDRYFELNKFNKKPCKLIGIAYDFQENDTIQSEPWDIPLDYIITNKEIIQT